MRATRYLPSVFCTVALLAASACVTTHDGEPDNPGSGDGVADAGPSGQQPDAAGGGDQADAAAQIPARCSQTFADVPVDHWALEEITALYVHEVTDGCNDDPLQFCPAAGVTRAQTAVFLVRALGEQPSAAAYNAYFEDIPNNSAAGYINRLFELDITTGTAPGIFTPDQVTQRQYMATFLVRALDEQPSAADRNAYFDDLLDNEAASFINRLFELGLTTGCGTRTFCPTDDTRRDEAAAFISRAFDLTTEVCTPGS